MNGNNMLLGFIGSAHAGKDTAFQMLQNDILQFTSPILEKDSQQERVFYNLRNASFSLTDEKNADAFFTRKFIASNKKTLNIFHLPLATEVKREFVVEMARNNVKIDFERLMIDPPYKIQFRPHFIEIGDGRKEIDALYWLNRVNALISCLSEKFADESNYNIFSITDMRYKDEPEHQEATYRNLFPTFTIKIECDLLIRLKRMPDKQAIDYMRKFYHNNSEKNTKRIKGDFTVSNNGTPNELHTQISEKITPCLSYLIIDWMAK
jgi:hypothetical protein